MSQNKQTVQKYMNAFAKTDHAVILSCLIDSVEWGLPGAFHVTGKNAFDKEIESDAFVGSPTIRVTRMTEEHNVVVAEGTVHCARKDGTVKVKDEVSIDFDIATTERLATAAGETFRKGRW